MINSIKTVNITKIINDVQASTEDEIVVESVLNLYVNRRFYSSLMCSPIDTQELAVGFLFAEGIITSMQSVKGIEDKGGNMICVILNHDIDEKLHNRRALTSGCAKGSIDLSIFDDPNIKAMRISSEYSANSILGMMKEFNHFSDIFKRTGGVHSCALCSSDEILYFAEDIGRHNALDKVIGKSLINNIDLSDKLLLTTGRISSDIAIKSARAGIPLIVSHSAPTDMAINIAQALNMTIAGFARGYRMNIYCGGNRITV